MSLALTIHRLLPGALLAAGLAGPARPAARAQIDPAANERVFFAFDDRSLPFQHGLRLQLVDFHLGAGEPDNIVLRPGPPGSPDAGGCYYYGSVIEVEGEFWMWYLGCPAPAHKGTEQVCVARSRDGIHWQRPNLGLVPFHGSRDNNLASLNGGPFYSDDPAVVLYEPDAADPGRRFKMVFNAARYGMRLAVAFSPDGTHWQEPTGNPRGPWLEPSGVMKWHGAYYLCGHARSTWTPNGDWTRVLDTYVSYDFEHWLPTPALGFRRDSLPPRPVAVTGTVDGEQVHLGASLWNRGNVIVGFYGQWHGVPSNDRRLVGIDLGLVVSHDGLHYEEPVPDFRIVAAKENIYAWPRQAFIGAPALAQGQGFANRNGQTLFWYGSWNSPADGVRLARWDTDRLGYLQPFVPPQQHPNLISEPIATGGKSVTVALNLDGVSDLSRVKVSILDEQCRPLPGFEAADCSAPARSGLKEVAGWGSRQTVTAAGPIRVRIDFAGVRPEDLKLYAVYLMVGQ